MTAKNRASKGDGSWKNYSKEKTAITFGEECITLWGIKLYVKTEKYIFVKLWMLFWKFYYDLQVVCNFLYCQLLKIWNSNKIF